jgi:elongation factor Ts
MAVLAEMIKQLRAKTNAGVLDCKKALETAGGDLDKAAALLKEKGLVAAAKKADRKVTDGRVDAYIHPGNKVGVLLEVNCETDFVALTPDFIALCHDLAMQVAATDPKWLSRDVVPADVLEQQKTEFRAQMAGENKPAAVLERIIEGKLIKFYGETCFMEQPFIKDESMTIQQLVTEAIAKLGENIVVARFVRYGIGR